MNWDYLFQYKKLPFPWPQNQTYIFYSVDSTGTFMDKLQSFQFCESDNMVSFDFSSLFTNVPLDEILGLIPDCVYKNNHL